MNSIKSYVNTTAFWTFLDQGIVSGSSLILSILLVSYLGIEGFGTYSLYWMAVLLISGFHQALIIMPLYTLFPKMDSLKEYVHELIGEQLLFSLLAVLLVLALFSGAFLLGYDANMYHGFLLGLIAGTFTFQDLLRRILFVKEHPLEVVFIDIVSVGIFPLILAFIWTFDAVNLSNVLLLIVVLKVLSILLAFYFISPKVSWKNTNNVRVRHWNSGKFLLASSVLQWFSGNAFVLVSGVLLGPASIGVLRIAQSILGVINVFFLFLENSIPIQAAKVLHEGGQGAFNKYMIGESKKYLWIFIFSLLCLGMFHQSITSFFYGNAMDNHQWLIPTYCFLYLLIYAGTMLRFAFRTLDQNKILFYGYVVSALVGLSCVYPMIKWLGLSGAILGLFTTQIATIATYIFYLNKNYGTI
ncbi:MAG: hypothetical protein P8P74_13020 [Crocinitomicaceae bacterium]|nr:hypothetical protein [Crocinitomicaceae bacterium]